MRHAPLNKMPSLGKVYSKPFISLNNGLLSSYITLGGRQSLTSILHPQISCNKKRTSTLFPSHKKLTLKLVGFPSAEVEAWGL